MINVSGHRIGTAEVESKLDEHPMCAEAAVVGYPHSVKGEAIYAYVILNGVCACLCVCVCVWVCVLFVVIYVYICI